MPRPEGRGSLLFDPTARAVVGQRSLELLERAAERALGGIGVLGTAGRARGRDLGHEGAFAPSRRGKGDRSTGANAVPITARAGGLRAFTPWMRQREVF